MKHCESCGSTHAGAVPCGLSFAERMRTTQVHQSVRESTTPHARYDEDAIEEQFGAPRKERQEEFQAGSRGFGTIKHDPRGGAWFKNRKSGNVEHVTDEKLEREFAADR